MDEQRSPALIDPAVLDRIWDDTGGDAEFMNEIVDAFVADSRMRLAAFVGAIGAGDAVTARAAVHSLRGASSSIGARAVADLAGAAERACRDDDVAAASVLVSQLEATLIESEAALAADVQRFGAGR